ncbi:hypothetical protein GCM10023313_32670 [Mucilaginibacter defluvii]|uniref:Uncharacterized protein n=2 Tax=Mucilaginibacter defluvii TaxID=1196019 RepID=A0ABP9G148_9SPHI
MKLTLKSLLILRLMIGRDIYKKDNENRPYHEQGKQLQIAKPQDAVAEGIILIPEDRRNQGVVTAMDIVENVSLPSLADHASYGLIRRRKEIELASKTGADLHIKAPALQTQLINLSGGNQQKILCFFL